MNEKVDEEAGLLGFRSAGTDCWRLHAEQPITLRLTDKEVFLAAEAQNITYRLRCPLGADFRLRLRKRLGTLKKKAARAARAQKRARHEGLKNALVVPVKPKESSEPSYGDSRSYNPLCFCEQCHRMVRENLMHDDKTCVDCKE